jgi:RHH-type transcriptional regulator, proline utilization regulon repressor / proline dehydrogenase / delta 1-pyrroline-5-carboxylate dehydrogenase
MAKNLESRTSELGRKLFELSSESSMSLFDKGFWSGKMMDWSMQNHDFKVQMFRFVDVLPVLNDSTQVTQHVKEYFLDDEVKIPLPMKAAMNVASTGGLIGKMAAGTIRKNVESMAEMFIAGENSEKALPALEKLWKQGLCFTVDILGEAVVSADEAADYQRRYLELVNGLAEKVRPWSRQESLEKTALGPLPRANVSVKCSSLYSQMNSFAHRASVDGIKERLRPILQAAVEKGVMLNLDAEQVDYKDIILSVAEELFSEPAFKSYPYFGVVVQAYLKSSIADLERVIGFAKKRGVPLTVRLVKGAYWDHEVIKSIENDWEIPVFTQKAESDQNFERCTEKLLNAYPLVLTALGSHNIRNLAYAMAYAEEKKIPKESLEIQMLFGMADPFKKAVRGMGYRLREYVPVGEILPGMAYLVRRLLENTSNEGFLRAKFVGGAGQDELLKNPTDRIVDKKVTKVGSASKDGFSNESPRDLGLPENRKRLENSLAKVSKLFPIKAYPVVGGTRRENVELVTEHSPSDRSLPVASWARSGVDLAEEAARTSKAAFKAWNKKPVTERVALVKKLAEKMRERHEDLMAIMMFEVAKTASEADGDVCEAIDFCEFYCHEMLRLAEPSRRAELPGESNIYTYQGRGPALVIAPWNFPLAILCGMTVAPLLAGNPVIMKPAEQASGIAKVLYDMMLEVGFPRDVVQFLPGRGEDVGAHLVNHADIHIINFTGSRAVGLKILEEASRVRPGQRHIKKVVAEMGGKNSMIVDDDADMDEAVLASLRAAFHFQGQKCSALSRLIVLESNYERFRDRLVQALKSMTLGSVLDPATRIGAVIDREAQERLLKTIERNRSKIIAQVEVSASFMEKGNYVPATLFEDNDFSSELSQQEHFGPLLAIYRVKSLDEAIEKLNDTDYALTGGIFSRSPKNIRQFIEQAEVGNAYINRGVTGSIVSRQPFGGFKLSGVGAKAGGPDYLLQFLEPRTVTENLMRRGFTPEL